VNPKSKDLGQKNGGEDEGKCKLVDQKDHRTQETLNKREEALSVFHPREDKIQT